MKLVYVGWTDITESMVTFSPFCGYKLAYVWS